ncbi:Uncharacterized protein Adt_22702 [Abeliophyllum distichum]|uniref:Uncharacterized protein n=1 Tax=Abeliophyllum distichum TaxID=126358 RepID=A0ABD1SBQ2_9LAMI
MELKDRPTTLVEIHLIKFIPSLLPPSPFLKITYSAPALEGHEWRIAPDLTHLIKLIPSLLPPSPFLKITYSAPALEGHEWRIAPDLTQKTHGELFQALNFLYIFGLNLENFQRAYSKKGA